MTGHFAHGSHAESNLKLVGFIVEDVCYGIDIMSIGEVVNPEGLIHIPTMPSYVSGVTNHRGNVVPIIDLRLRFGLPKAEPTRRTKWLLVRIEAHEVGLQVDSITAVHKVDPELLVDKFTAMNDQAQPWIKSAHQTDRGLVFELDVSSLVDPKIFKDQSGDVKS